MRVTVTAADRDNALTPEISPAPQVGVWRNARYPSSIVLPVIPVSAERISTEASAAALSAESRRSWILVIAMVILSGSAAVVFLLIRLNNKALSKSGRKD
jgi:hypothetical protein